MKIKNYNFIDIEVDEKSFSNHFEKIKRTLSKPFKVVCEINDFNNLKRNVYYLSKPDELINGLVFCVEVGPKNNVIKAKLINTPEPSSMFEIYPGR